MHNSCSMMMQKPIICKINLAQIFVHKITNPFLMRSVVIRCCWIKIPSLIRNIFAHHERILHFDRSIIRLVRLVPNSTLPWFAHFIPVPRLSTMPALRTLSLGLAFPPWLPPVTSLTLLLGPSSSLSDKGRAWWSFQILPLNILRQNQTTHICQLHLLIPGRTTHDCHDSDETIYAVIENT